MSARLATFKFKSLSKWNQSGLQKSEQLGTNRCLQPECGNKPLADESYQISPAPTQMNFQHLPLVG
ncbi:hypothetical protein [Gimesia fumaroli]|uniref:hypothetical protein n=1 Tax=Gimesia fumaroli TaxID=2527976 RepID=UPI00119FCE1A|nr:hypothetical protein [Gimesia fumaroli]